jgi:flagellin
VASIMTNASALTALQSLNTTNKALEMTQSRISTGFRVATASDNAAYWSIATTMRSDKSSLSVVQDALGLGGGKVDTAYSAMDKVKDVMVTLRGKLEGAVNTSDASKAKIQGEIDALQDQLRSFSDGATYAGANWLTVKSTETGAGLLDGVQADAKIVSSFNRDTTGKITLGTIDVKVENTKLFESGTTAKDGGILDHKTSIWNLATAQTAYDTAYATSKAAGDDDASAEALGVTAGNAIVGSAKVTLSVYNLDITAAGVNDDFVTKMVNVVDAALTKVTDAATKLGTAKTRIDLQKEFSQSLMDSIDRGVGQLVDADMNKESTRLQALQVQQQLGIQALSIANSNSQSILSLFKS